MLKRVLPESNEPDIEVVFQRNDIVLNPIPYNIGRGQSSDYIIPDYVISRRHCLINKDANGSWFIEDLSNNGIQVNEQLIGKGKTHPLSDKDRISLADNHVFEFFNISKKPLEQTTLNTANNENPPFKGYVPESTLTKLAIEHRHKIARLELKHENDLDMKNKQRLAAEDHISKVEDNLRKANKQVDDLSDELKNVTSNASILETTYGLKEIDCEELRREVAKLQQEKNELRKELDVIKYEREARAKEGQEKELMDLRKQLLFQETEIKKKFVTNLESIMDSEVACAVCLEIVIESCTINCGHTFCAKCIQDLQKQKKALCLCPTCRAKVVSISRSAMLDSYIAKMTENLSNEFKHKRNQAVQERKSATGPTGAKKRKTNHGPVQQALPFPFLFPFPAAVMPIPEPEVFIDLTTTNYP